MLFETLVASFVIALLSLIGVFLFGKQGHLLGTNRFIIPVAIGVFLGVVFFELIPETLEVAGAQGSIAILAGFLTFYLLSHVLYSYHHHHNNDCPDGHCEDKTGASMLLIGDGIHNITDGIVIASAFLVSPAVGVATTIGIALHEIPQEIAEFGVLLKAGYNKTRAALYNFLSALSVVLGAALTLVLAEQASEYIWILTGIAAGNLLFIAATDFIPDVQEEHRRNGRFTRSFLMTLIGLIGIVFILNWAHEEFGHGHEHEGETGQEEILRGDHELHDEEDVHEHNHNH